MKQPNCASPISIPATDLCPRLLFGPAHTIHSTSRCADDNANLNNCRSNILAHIQTASWLIKVFVERGRPIHCQLSSAHPDHTPRNDRDSQHVMEAITMPSNRNVQHKHSSPHDSASPNQETQPTPELFIRYDAMGTKIFLGRHEELYLDSKNPLTEEERSLVNGPVHDIRRLFVQQDTNK